MGYETERSTRSLGGFSELWSASETGGAAYSYGAAGSQHQPTGACPHPSPSRRSTTSQPRSLQQRLQPQVPQPMAHMSGSTMGVADGDGTETRGIWRVEGGAYPPAAATTSRLSSGSGGAGGLGMKTCF